MTLGFDYGHDICLCLFGGNRDARISFGADWYHSDDYISAASNETVVSPFDRVNAFAAIDIEENWRLGFTMEKCRQHGKRS